MASVLQSFYLLPWFLVARMMINYGLSQSFLKRFFFLITLPAVWVSIEWLRCQFTLGFPWCPLSVTQWERPIILQALAWCGAWSLSFFLIFFNLCIGSYLHHLLVRRRLVRSGVFSSFCPDFYLGIIFFLLLLAPFFLSNNSHSERSPKEFRVGISQPYLRDKWKGENALMHKQILSRQSLLLSSMEPDLIVWPEASTPYALNLDRQWVEALVTKTEIPLFLGAVIKETDASYNTVARILPDSGLDSLWYAKRILVPFGEYVPFPFRLIPGLRKIVGPVGSFAVGDHFYSLSLPQKDGDLKIGPLICYEDIFPALSRDAVDGGSEILFVATNDAWFGEDGCAEQHAAHSVMRAVESGRAVLRCGNAGWSGWIDALGYKQEVLKDDKGSIYFQGAGIVEISTKHNRDTFYSKRGDFFPIICLFLSGISFFASVRQKDTFGKQG